MAVFMELTAVDGDKVVVNADLIRAIRPVENGCYLYFDLEHIVAVQETAKVVWATAYNNAAR